MAELTIGTDCSGIEAPIQALKQMNIPYHHVFSSETDKFCLQSIKANYDPDIIFGDITKRDVKDVPKVDLYVCGFPCQPYSSAGYKKGLDDPRSNVFFHCIDTILHILPSVFVLENVRTLLTHNKGITWVTIRNNLQKLIDNGYYIQWKVLNTKDYGIPQCRERLFIVGCREEGFQWPEEIGYNPIHHYVDTNDTRVDIIKRKHASNIPTDGVFINLNYLGRLKFVNSHMWSGCITAESKLWCIPKHRYANVKEYLRLQGFPEDFKQVVSNTQMKKQIGNSMSVCVLVAIFKNLLKHRL